jgi:phosphopantothenoylcysteine decarboxylase/phosphopantothenate--cysteine ligase
MSLSGKSILLGVTGGIAAYKAVYLLRLFRRAGAEVKVVMTEAACEFITPLTFESLSENPVHIRMFGSQSGGVISPIEHIDLAKWPDLVVVAPCTANTIAKFAHGKADDLLATLVAAYRGRVLIAPAMNDAMWENEANLNNLTVLSNRGFLVAPPEEGDLACGYEATGRMAEPETIFGMVESLFASDFSGVRVLVSAGGTEEDIDPVRVISNRSSGKMGFAIAEAARDMGAVVTVVAAGTSVPPPHGVRVMRVRTSAEMSRALKEAFADHDVLLMAAAVSDFRPAETFDSKAKGDVLELELKRTEDILSALGAQKNKRMIVGFALETDEVEANALEKMRKKHCDLMVVNNPRVEGAAFSHDTNVVTILGPAGKLYESVGPEPKRAIARRILELLAGEDEFQNLPSRLS